MKNIKLLVILIFQFLVFTGFSQITETKELIWLVQPTETSDTDDEYLVVDQSSNATEKITLATLAARILSINGLLLTSQQIEIVEDTMAAMLINGSHTNISVAYDDINRVLNLTGSAPSGGGAVDSVNSQTGVVVLDADDIDDTSTLHKFVTSAQITDLASNTAHRNIVSGNPHNVTKTEIGLSDVDNTSDLNKPISTATQSALNAKANTSDIGITIQPYFANTDIDSTDDLTVADLDDDDTMASASPTRLASSESIKAYVDANINGGNNIIQEEGTPLTSRSALNFIGPGITAADDAANDRINITLLDYNNVSNLANGSVSNTEFQYIGSLVSDAQQQLDSKLNITGGSLSGNVSFQGVGRVTSLLDPINPQDAVTLSFLNGQLDPNWITSEPTGRTNEETYSNFIAQPWVDSEADGPAPAGTLLLEFNVPPAFISTGTTLNMDDYRGYNTGVSAATAYTLTLADNGGFTYLFVNAPSEPTFTGTGITVINPVDSLAFIPNDNMLAIVWMLTSTTALQWWIDIP